jgi:hypothetical protein
MKGVNLIIPIFFTFIFVRCQTIDGKVSSVADQKVILRFDDLKVPVSATTTNKGDDIYLSSYIKQNTNFGISIMSEKNDFQFAISAKMPELKVGSYQIYKCGTASECNETEEEWNQYAGISPYPKKDGSLDESKIKLFYKSTKLGLNPMTLIITKITDEQLLGSAVKTKKVFGTFSGIAANVKSKDYSWYVVGPTTKIDCEFELYCTIL